MCVCFNLKGPKHETLVVEFFTQSKPEWVKVWTKKVHNKLKIGLKFEPEVRHFVFFSVWGSLYHRERILETSTLSCNEEEEEITKPPKRWGRAPDYFGCSQNGGTRTHLILSCDLVASGRRSNHITGVHYESSITMDCIWVREMT